MGKCVRIGLIWLGFAAAIAEAGPANLFFKAAQKAERAGDSLRAYMLYNEAAALDPGNRLFITHKNAMQSWAAMAPQMTTTSFAAPAFTIQAPDYAQMTADRIQLEGISPSEAILDRPGESAPHLRRSNLKTDFDIQGTPKTMFEQVGRAFGIEFEFDKDFQGPSAFRFHVENVGMEDSFRMLEALNSAFIVPVNSTKAVVFPETAQKRTDSAPVVTVALQIPARMTVQEAQELITAVQQTMGIKKVGVDANRRVLVLRDQVGVIAAAEQLLAELSRLRAQVEMDVDFLTVDKSSSLAYGLSLPNAAQIVNLGKSFNNTALSLSGLTKLATFGGGVTFLGMGISDAQAMATLTKSSTSTLLHSQVIAVDQQQLSFHVGDSYPIITSAFYGATGTTGTATGITAPPAVQYKDLGLILQITPTVHDHNDVTLVVQAEYDFLSGATNNDIPVISSRKVNGTVRLVEGEWAAIAGLTQTQVSETTGGFPLLGRIPWLGALFRNKTKTRDAQQTLLLLKPRVVNLPPWEFPSTAMWVGSDSRPLNVY